MKEHGRATPTCEGDLHQYSWVALYGEATQYPRVPCQCGEWTELNEYDGEGKLVRSSYVRTVDLEQEMVS